MSVGKTTATQRPCVTVSYAQTLDGRSATATGSSQWISGPESLRFAHALRASHGAILVGVGTVCRDNPRLTVRLVSGRDPLRVVVDSTLRTPDTAAVLTAEAARGTLFATTERASATRRATIAARGAAVLLLPSGVEGGVDLTALLASLHARGIRSVLVEGGAALVTALLRARLVDRLAVTVAPKVLGTGLAAVGDLGIRDLDGALLLKEMTVTAYGVDWVLDGRVTYPDGVDGR